MKVKIGLDDALDAFGVHGVGGLLGNVFTGVFASKRIAGINGAVISGGWIDGMTSDNVALLSTLPMRHLHHRPPSQIMERVCDKFTRLSTRILCPSSNPARSFGSGVCVVIRADLCHSLRHEQGSLS